MTKRMSGERLEQVLRFLSWKDHAMADELRAEIAALSADLEAARGAALEVQTILDLLNPLHGSLDMQTYDERLAANFYAPSDAEYEVTVSAQQERDLTQAVLILERALKDQKP